MAFRLLLPLWLSVSRLTRGARQDHGQDIVLTTSTSALTAKDITIETEGELGTLQYRINFKGPSGPISPWHDIPLRGEGNDTFNMVVEIPKNTKRKMECMTKKDMNPIMQDVQDGKPREYVGPIFWNYGYLPQTWEDNTEKDPHLGLLGDDDPIDVVEIGTEQRSVGSVVEIKVLGCLAMIDGGELDYKIIAIATDDPQAEKLWDVTDVDRLLPGFTSGILEWFRWYKFPKKGKLNAFGYDGLPMGVHATYEAIEDTHKAWSKLTAGKAEGKHWYPKKAKSTSRKSRRSRKR